MYKGEDYRPDLCDHESDDGCQWCCQTCNYDRHVCHGCGTVSDHHDTTCPECVVAYGLNDLTASAAEKTKQAKERG